MERDVPGKDDYDNDDQELTEEEAEAFVKLIEETVPGTWDAGFPPDGSSAARNIFKLLGAIKPRDVATNGTHFLTELVSIALGKSERKPDKRDMRFADSAWEKNPIFKRLCQSYLAWSEAVENIVDSEGKEDWHDRERAKMLVEILTSTAAPSNFLLSNPEAIDKALRTRGKSLLKGMNHAVEDLLNGRKIPRHVTPGRFEVGRNLAMTPGEVVFRNPVLELIQYTPVTAEVLAEPTLLITPQINKYYFMDLAPGRSFVEYAVARGIPLFIVSWRNPGKDQGHWDLDTYISACIEAVDAVCDITGNDGLNTLGICAGGITSTVLTNTLLARGDNRIKRAAYAVTLLDFDVPCPIGAFRSEAMLKLTRRTTEAKGILPGRDLGTVFSWMRPNDLIWRYWINNYLLGNEPPSFDILFWNDDPTNLPHALHQQFLQAFEHNVLCHPGELTVLGHPVDLSAIEMETFVTGAEADHLTPWTGCYQTTQLIKGKSTFVLSNAGHIAGLINPPTNAKASYYIGSAEAENPEDWKATARREQGTWWQAWADWLYDTAETTQPAPKKPGNRRYPPLEPAPGSYVKLQPPS